MGILFSDVYRKAIALFDDPRITTAYETNPLQFNKIMYTYLQNAISMFNNPLSVSLRLSQYKEPKGIMQVFEGDGKNNKFEATVEGNNGGDALAKNFLEGLNNATSYEGDENNLYLLYKPQSNTQTFRMVFRVVSGN